MSTSAVAGRKGGADYPVSTGILVTQTEIAVPLMLPWLSGIKSLCESSGQQGLYISADLIAARKLL